MISKFWNSRGMVKFRRDRMAVVGSCVIWVYFLVALLVGMFGLIDRDDYKQRVLPNRYPGFLEEPSRDNRIRFTKWWWEGHYGPAQSALEGTPPERFEIARDEQLKLAERGVPGTAEEVMAGLAELEQAFENFERQIALEEDWADEVLALEEMVAELAEEGGSDPDLEAELEEYRGELVTSRAAVDQAMSGFEDLMLRVQPMPSGWDGFLFRMRTFLGSDSKGASVAAQATYSVKIAFQIGFVTALISVVVGSLLGAAAGFYGGVVDGVVMYLVSTLSSIPYLVLLSVIAFMFTGTSFDDATNPAKALVPVYVAFCSVFWISTCRVVRGEVFKIKELEYVQAATAVGFSRFYILVRHVIPNTAHLMFINFSLLFIGAIKSEVILSFLGLGVKGQPSWGIMINLGRDGVTSFQFWEVGVATAFMFVLVLAFNVVSDALQDAFDPKHVG